MYIVCRYLLISGLLDQVSNGYKELAKNVYLLWNLCTKVPTNPQIPGVSNPVEHA